MTSKTQVLTRHQIGLDRQSHYAHKDVIVEVFILDQQYSQLYDQNKTISFEWPAYTAVKSGVHDAALQWQ